MDIYIEDEDLKELIETGKNRKYKKFSKDKVFMQKLVMVIQTMRAVSNTRMLGSVSFLHYERLKHSGRSSIRIMNGRVERLIFRESEDGKEVTIIILDETHYGNKK
nr:hypothetical protein [uncultured Prevotella sp.]